MLQSLCAWYVSLWLWFICVENLMCSARITFIVATMNFVDILLKKKQIFRLYENFHSPKLHANLPFSLDSSVYLCNQLYNYWIALGKWRRKLFKIFIWLKFLLIWLFKIPLETFFSKMSPFCFFWRKEKAKNLEGWESCLATNVFDLRVRTKQNLF